MPNTPCNAFLQPHVRPVSVRLTCGARLIPGTKVGVWRVDGDPHWGPRSATYPVVLADSEDRAAMTVFDAPALHLGSYPRRILSIAQRLATVEHPGIASIVDAGLTADGRPYVVTDLEQAVPLKECLTGTDIARSLTILRAICAPLLAAHDVGIAHGSLELEHVFIIESDARYVKLIDWGIERAVFDEAQRAGLESPAGAASAPEAALGLCSPQMDAFALGTIACRLLDDDVPPALAQLVSELLAEDPRQRPSLRATADRLSAIQREIERPPVVVMPDLIPVPPVELRPHRPWRAAFASAAFATAAAVGVAAMPASPMSASVAAPVLTSIAITTAALPPITQPIALLAPPAMPAPVPTVSVTPAVTSIAASAVATVTAPAAIMRKPVAKVATPPSVRRPRVPAMDDARRNELLGQYQRLGRALYELQAQRGVAATSELMQEFRALKIQPALATHESRAAAAARLGDLRSRIERQRGIDVADACLKNALADGCR